MPMLDPGGEARNYKLYVRNCGGVITCVYSTITGNGIVQKHTFEVVSCQAVETHMSFSKILAIPWVAFQTF